MVVCLSRALLEAVLKTTPPASFTKAAITTDMATQATTQRVLAIVDAVQVA